MEKEEFDNLKISTLFDAIQKYDSPLELETFAKYVIAPLVKSLDEKGRLWLRDAYTSRMDTLKTKGDPTDLLNKAGKKYYKGNCEEK